jgi:hypothetical protein
VIHETEATDGAYPAPHAVMHTPLCAKSAPLPHAVAVGTEGRVQDWGTQARPTVVHTVFEQVADPVLVNPVSQDSVHDPP